MLTSYICGMSSQKPKIAIIGGGPAGATTSLFLSKYGIEHTLFDKEVFPRHKTCGDGLTMEVLRTLNEIDPALGDEFTKLDFVAKSGGMYLRDAKNREIEVDYRVEGGISPVYVAKRYLFDDWLFQKTKNSDVATIKEGVAVDGIVREGKGFLLTIEGKEEYFDFLIGCDGERSILKKSLTKEGIKKVREHHAGSIRTYYKGVKKLNDMDPLEFYLLDSFTGYFWIFHLPNGECNVGIGALSQEISNNKINLKKELLNFIETNEFLKERFKDAEMIEPIKGWGIPLNSNRIDYFGDGYLLIGDSASMAEPATGKGIGIAMFISYLGIPLIRKAIEKNDFSKETLSEFQSVVMTKFEKEWDALHKWTQVFQKKWMVNLMFFLGRIPLVYKSHAKKTSVGIQKFVKAKNWK